LWGSVGYMSMFEIIIVGNDGELPGFNPGAIGHCNSTKWGNFGPKSIYFAMFDRSAIPEWEAWAYLLTFHYAAGVDKHYFNFAADFNEMKIDPYRLKGVAPSRKYVPWS